VERSQAPAARNAVRLLKTIASQPGPVPAAALARELGLPRSTTYHLLGELQSEGFVVHLPADRRWGLGVSAFELGTAYTRQAPLARLATPALARLVDDLGHTAHLAVLHGREVLYVVEERAPGRPPLVTDVGVRLPAQLTASGRAMLAELPAAQVRALFPDASAFVERHGTGPSSLTALRRLLVDVRRRGYATEDGEITPGFASVAAAVLDHTGHPLAAVAVTYPDHGDEDFAVRAAERAGLVARKLTRQVGGQPV
jgi:DNA-binding IclR family transcriptional regulator